MSEDAAGAADDEADDPYDLDSGPDPAAYAASAPEWPIDDAVTADDRHDGLPVHAVGVGPGNPDFLTPAGERAIRDADVVVGFETVVDVVRERTDADLLTCGYRDEAETLERFADRVAAGERGAAVLMGDPNHSGYQFVGKVEAAVAEAVDAAAEGTGAGNDSPEPADSPELLGSPVRIVPGISSLQMAASRARTPMEDTTFVTLHKSGDVEPDLERCRAAVGDRHLLVLPRPFDLMPEDVAGELLAAGAEPSLTALVLERLTHDDEAITRTTLGELANRADEAAERSPFSDLSVLAVRAG